MAIDYQNANRVGDHIWWVGSTAKFASHYPAWTYTYDVETILAEMYEANQQTWDVAWYSASQLAKVSIG